MNRAGRLSKFALSGYFLLLALSALGEQDKRASPSPTVYLNESFGFRYEPPLGMRDETERGRVEIRARSEARHANKILVLLLSMTSGPRDTAEDWHSVTIETYPRTAFSDLDDASAEAKMNAWVAGLRVSPGVPRSVVLSGQTFAVSVFGQQAGAVKKGAVVWTTIRKGKLLSFAFVANSPQQLMKLAETMKTVEFF